MTSPQTVLNGNSVKTKLYNTPPPPPYFLVLSSSVNISEVKAIESHRISKRWVHDVVFPPHGSSSPVVASLGLRTREILGGAARYRTQRYRDRVPLEKDPANTLQ